MDSLDLFDSLGGYIEHLMAKENWSNRELAHQAGISEGAVRNLLKFGVDKDAKEPSASIISQVAEALDVDAVILFRLAGYIKPPSAISLAGERLVHLFEQFSLRDKHLFLAFAETMYDQQDAPVLKRLHDTTAIKPDSEEELSGPIAWELLRRYTEDHSLLRSAANTIIFSGLFDKLDAELAGLTIKVENIPDDMYINDHEFGALPQSIKERIVALILAKVQMTYDHKHTQSDILK